MSLKLGNKDVDGIMLGDKEVSVVYKGTEEVWSSGVNIGPIENITEVFSTWLYKGNGVAHDIVNGTNLSSGGLVWIKSRRSGDYSALQDTERGAKNYVRSELAEAQGTSLDDKDFKSFNSDGFSLNGGMSNTNINYNDYDYVAWSFQKRPGFMDIVEYGVRATPKRYLTVWAVSRG